MKNKLLQSPQHEISILDSLFAEMILDEALLKFRKKQLHQNMDQALFNRNKSEFLRLTEELKNITD